ncbi:MAG: nucleotidyltransferase family protein [Chloroflexota bacterium]
MQSVAIDKDTEKFYVRSLRLLLKSDVPFMVGGAYALREYADIYRDTKDIDVFSTMGAFPRLLSALQDAGYDTEVTDASWLAKARQGERYVDIIFASANGVAPVDDSWLRYARDGELFGCPVRLLPVEELLWQKMLLQDRHRFDGADVNHILRKQGPALDWKRLLMRMEPNWEVLLSQLLMFRFVYPAERDHVPRWLLDELLQRVQNQLDVPTPLEKICRGRRLSKHQYDIDTEEWGYRPQ